ncbi:helix-turn-helix domain-containing protein [Holdemanella porci]|uniref:helix-turn-helix domain-containing protein n=1 Tax=Holdemanella porci TaxID=2652276 RepID=UPI003F8F213B
MPDFNNDILIKNIKLQMQKHNETQSQLAEVIGMTQSNFSKAINGVESKRFSIEQLYGISQHYGVGIDALLGNKADDNLTLVSISSFLRKLIENSIADLVELEYTDIKYKSEYDGYTDQYYVNSYADKNTYTAIVFPNTKFEPKYLSKSEADKLKQKYAKNGNRDYRNECINEFLKKYTQLYRLYRRGDLEYDVLELACQHYIEELDLNEILC